MRECRGNLWRFHRDGAWIVVPTNGSVRRDGYAVMGRGVAAQAAQRFPTLQATLGGLLMSRGNHVIALPAWRFFTYPVKARWMERATVRLIDGSARELQERVETDSTIPLPVYLPWVGCGNGGLSWDSIRPILLPLLDDRFVAVAYQPTLAQTLPVVRP